MPTATVKRRTLQSVVEKVLDSLQEPFDNEQVLDLAKKAVASLPKAERPRAQLTKQSISMGTYHYRHATPARDNGKLKSVRQQTAPQPIGTASNSTNFTVDDLAAANAFIRVCGSLSRARIVLNIIANVADMATTGTTS